MRGAAPPTHPAWNSIELSCGAEHAGEHVALAGDGYALTKVASAEVDGASASVAYATEEAFSSVDRNWAALDGAGLRAAAHEVFAHAEKHGVKPQATAHADAAGKAVFSSLKPGLYLISRFEVVPANAEFSCDLVAGKRSRDDRRRAYLCCGGYA